MQSRQDLTNFAPIKTSDSSNKNHTALLCHHRSIICSIFSSLNSHTVANESPTASIHSFVACLMSFSIMNHRDDEWSEVKVVVQLISRHDA